MTYSVSQAPKGVTRLAIQGELDSFTSGDLRGEIQKLLALQPAQLEIDLSRLTMIDSAGVGALVALYKGVLAQGGDAVVVGLQDQPLAIFKLLRLDQVMVRPRSSRPSS